jgi:uncharacterized OB-fold protein
MSYKKPVPVPSIESKPYWNALRDHRLLMPHCDDCGHSWFPPSLLCPACNSSKIGWKQSSGRGTVFSFVVFHRVYHPGYEGEVPYAVGLIELEEGPRIVSNVIGLPTDQIACGMPVKIVYDDIVENVTIPKFEPVES